MALHEVYSHPVRQEYRAYLCSKASLFQLISLLITIICPWLIVYACGGMWQRTNTYMEQPEVHFTHEFAMFTHGLDPSEYLFWSTYPILNELAESKIRIATVTATEV
jgi:hypothetical protein